MSLTYGFFNSVDGDRMYNAIQVSSIFDGIIEDGIFGSIGDAFQVLATTSLGTSVGTGRAWFNHTWTYNDAVIQIVLDGSDPILPRYDAIILEVDESVGVRANSIKKVTGTPATTPEYPTLTNTESVHQYPFAYILVNGGATTITQASITSMIGQGACPFVTGPLSVISTNDLVAQWEEEFNAWFDQMQGQLTEEAAGNLQAQINSHNHAESTSTKVVTDGIATGAITLEKLASDSVDDTKIQYRVPTLTARQGASPYNWDDGQGASSNYTPTDVKMAVGVKTAVVSSGIAEYTFTITFPEVFYRYPLVYCTLSVVDDEFDYSMYSVVVVYTDTSSFKAKIRRSIYSANKDITIHWLAIGQPGVGVPIP